METVRMELKIYRSENNELVSFNIPKLNNVGINITNSDTSDIENLFNRIFEEIIGNNKLIEFELNDDSNDLFYEVAKEIVNQLNIEIKNSEDDFKRIIELNKL